MTSKILLRRWWKIMNMGNPPQRFNRRGICEKPLGRRERRYVQFNHRKMMELVDKYWDVKRRQNPIY